MSPDKYSREEKRPISTSAVIRLVIWSVALCILAGVFSAAMLLDGGGLHFYLYDDFDDDGDGGNYSVGNGAVSAAVSEISINWVAGSVTVLLTDGDEIRITEDYDGDHDDNRLRWRVDDGELSIRYCRKIRYSDKVGAKNLTVEIPRSAALLSELQIVTVSATQDIRVSARELDIETVSGSAAALGDYDSVDAETVSGDVNFEGYFRIGSFEGASGNLELHLTKQAAELDVDTVSGRTRLVLPEDTTGFSVDRESVSGRVEVNGFSFDSVGSDRWGDGSMDIRLESVSGNLVIERETGN